MPRYANANANFPSRVREYLHHLNENDGNILMSMLGHRIISGGMITTPTAANAQVTGAGNTTWNVNASYAYMAGDNDYHELAATVSLAVHSGSQLFVVGQWCTAAIVIYKAAATGVKTALAVKGTVAASLALVSGPSDGALVSPAAGSIQAAINTADSSTQATWWKLGEVTITRTSDVVLTATYANIKGDRGIAPIADF